MKMNGPWSLDQIDLFFEQTCVPIRIAANGASGHPLLVSLWFVPLEGKLWCATQRSAHLVTLLRQDPRCAFELALESPPYRGVRGPGMARLNDDRGEEVLQLLIDRYLGDSSSQLARYLLGRVENETAISIEPQTLTSWDYRARMGDST